MIYINFRDIQTHLTPSLAELSILKTQIFPWVNGEWNKLNPEICSSGSFNIFRKLVLNFIWPRASKVYNINNTIGIKLIIWLR